MGRGPDPALVADARRARAAKPPEKLDAIAERLGVSQATVYRWANPNYAERSRANARKWKAKNREHVRVYDRERLARLREERKQKQERHKNWKAKELRRKARVRRSAEAAARLERIMRMANEGMSPEQIAPAVGTTAKQVHRTVLLMKGQR